MKQPIHKQIKTESFRIIDVTQDYYKYTTKEARLVLRLLTTHLMEYAINSEMYEIHI